MSRDSIFQPPRTELYYYDETEKVYKPITRENGVPVQVTGSTVLNGKTKNVATAGTRVQLDNIPCKEVTVIARKGNTGSIYVGGIDVSSILFGVELIANESFTFAVSNANLIYIDTSVSGEGVSYVAI
jgi:hypothetical protein